MYVFTIEAAALAEALEARAWYAARSPSIAEAFDHELAEALNGIASTPMRWPTPWPGIHRCVLRRFPYLIAYVVRGPHINVIAIAHGRRRPAYWWRRGLPPRCSEAVHLSGSAATSVDAIEAELVGVECSAAFCL